MPGNANANSPAFGNVAVGGTFVAPPPAIPETFFLLAEDGMELATEDDNNFRRERDA